MVIELMMYLTDCLCNAADTAGCRADIEKAWQRAQGAFDMFTLSFDSNDPAVWADVQAFMFEMEEKFRDLKNDFWR